MNNHCLSIDNILELVRTNYVPDSTESITALITNIMNNISSVGCQQLKYSIFEYLDELDKHLKNK